MEQLVPEPLGLSAELPGVRPLPSQTTRGRERQHVWALGHLQGLHPEGAFWTPEAGSHVVNPVLPAVTHARAGVTGQEPVVGP